MESMPHLDLGARAMTTHRLDTETPEKKEEATTSNRKRRRSVEALQGGSEMHIVAGIESFEGGSRPWSVPANGTVAWRIARRPVPDELVDEYPEMLDSADIISRDVTQLISPAPVAETIVETVDIPRGGNVSGFSHGDEVFCVVQETSKGNLGLVHPTDGSAPISFELEKNHRPRSPVSGQTKPFICSNGRLLIQHTGETLRISDVTTETVIFSCVWATAACISASNILLWSKPHIVSVARNVMHKVPRVWSQVLLPGVHADSNLAAGDEHIFAGFEQTVRAFSFEGRLLRIFDINPLLSSWGSEERINSLYATRTGLFVSTDFGRLLVDRAYSE